MSYSKNSRGQVFHSSSAGTYPINNGDPQNDDDEFDEEEFERQEAEYIDHLLTQMDQQ